MSMYRHAAPAALLAAAIAVTAAACSGSGSGDPLQGMTGKQVVTKAIADSAAAPAVKVTGTSNQSGQPIGLNLSLVKGHGCEGTLSEGNVGSFKLIYNGTSVWIMPDKKFWEQQANSIGASAVARYEGKYIKTSPGNSTGFGAMAGLCSVRQLLKSGTSSSFGTPAKTQFDGQSALKIPDKTKNSSAYVSDTATPKILGITKPGSSGGTVTFTYPSAPPPITAPPASEVVDGSKLGL